MVIDLSEILIEQDKLNRSIFEKHQIIFKQVEGEIKLALLVELGELANEIRSFKYWSDKEPSEPEVILDEYADGLHFIATFCIMYGVKGIFMIDDGIPLLDKKQVTAKFIKLFKLVSKISPKSKSAKNRAVVRKLAKKYLTFAYNLGFTEEDIKTAYFKKHNINIKRQETNY